jgi:hypothetical protein
MPRSSDTARRRRPAHLARDSRLPATVERVVEKLAVHQRGRQSLRRAAWSKSLGLRWDSDISGRAAFALIDNAKFLVLQRETGARGIRTLVAGYPTNRISRSREGGAGTGGTAYSNFSS